jgi:hypothetical protein
MLGGEKEGLDRGRPGGGAQAAFSALELGASRGQGRVARCDVARHAMVGAWHRMQEDLGNILPHLAGAPTVVLNAASVKPIGGGSIEPMSVKRFVSLNNTDAFDWSSAEPDPKLGTPFVAIFVHSI